MSVVIDATKAFVLILFVLFGLVGFMTGGVSETIGAFSKMDIEDLKELLMLLGGMYLIILLIGLMLFCVGLPMFHKLKGTKLARRISSFIDRHRSIILLGSFSILFGMVMLSQPETEDGGTARSVSLNAHELMQSDIHFVNGK